MVEFALILPVFILIMMGLIEFGRVYNETLIVTAAAREGARTASVKGDWHTAAKNAASTIDRGKLLPTINTAPVTGQPVTVTVTNEVDIITPLIQPFFGGSKYIVRGTATMRVE
jgi:Flp pilus assembly protein TadG